MSRAGAGSPEGLTLETLHELAPHGKVEAEFRKRSRSSTLMYKRSWDVHTSFQLCPTFTPLRTKGKEQK